MLERMDGSGEGTGRDTKGKRLEGSARGEDGGAMAGSAGVEDGLGRRE